MVLFFSLWSSVTQVNMRPTLNGELFGNVSALFTLRFVVRREPVFTFNDTTVTSHIAFYNVPK